MAKYILPAGTYFFGDPCYVTEEDLYQELWSKADDGVHLAEHNGHKYFIGRTAYGDGEYDGFPVDSGQLGLIPIELSDPTEVATVIGVEGQTDAALKITSSSDITMLYTNGRFTVIWHEFDGRQRSFQVDTDYEDDFGDPDGLYFGGLDDSGFDDDDYYDEDLEDEDEDFDEEDEK